MKFLPTGPFGDLRVFVICPMLDGDDDAIADLLLRTGQCKLFGYADSRE